MKKFRFATLTSSALALASGGLFAASFSLTPVSPTEAGIGTGGDEIWVPGPGPTGTGTPGAVGPTFNVDGFSYGHFGVTGAADIIGVEFSVDPASTSAFAGSPIGSELAAGETAAADIWGAPSPPVGAHFGVWDADERGPGPLGLGGAPALGLVDLPGAGGIDDIDGWDSRFPPAPGVPIFFSLDGPSAGALGFVGGDILFSAFAPGYAPAAAPYASELALGLGMSGFGDEVDALVVIEDGLTGYAPGADAILFSLAPGSPSLASSFGTGGPPVSAADVLIDPVSAGLLGIPQPWGAGAPGVAATAGLLDLAFTDNLDALDIHVIPEPGAFSLLGLAFVGFLLRRRR